MLVPPQIVARPGDNYTAATGCMFTGSVHPDEGPYAATTIGNFSRSAVKELAEALGLLVNEKAQVRFESLLNDLTEAKATAAKRGEEVRELTNAFNVTIAELHAVQEERNELADKLEKTKTSAAITRDAVAKLLNPKEVARV